MHRREFLKALSAVGIAHALPQSGWANGPADTFQAFHRARQRHAWLAGWESIDQTVLPRTAVDVVGDWPAALRGTFYRNGPALFERDGMRYQHWFDGDGMLQAWRLSAAGVTHEARVIDTSKFHDEARAGRFLYNAAGTAIPDARATRNADAVNTANTSVMNLNGQVYALWEGGSAWQVDTNTLDSLGAKTWRDGLESVPFSAHPLFEADGSLWNIGSAAYIGGGTVLIWRIDAKGVLQSITPLDVGHRGYIHSFTMTDRHLLLVLAPLMLDSAVEGPYFDHLHWRPEQASRLLIIDKHDPTQLRQVDLPTGMAFHWADAHERNGDIVLSGAWADSGELANTGFKAVMRGDPVQAAAPTRLTEFRIDNAGRVRSEVLSSHSIEFPEFDRRFDAPGGRTYLLAQPEPNESDYFDTVISINRYTGAVDAFRYGDHHLVEEHRFVPRPGATNRDDGWLIGTAMDYRAGKTMLSVFDACHLADGPLVQATLKRTLPLSFHANFVTA